MKRKEILGIDIGGSGIKGAPVNTKNGKLLEDRHRIPTPQPSSPENVAQAIKDLVKYFDWKGPIGCGFPAIVQNGMVFSAANVDKSWINTNAKKIFSKATGLPVWVVNDADAAGMAEATLGAGAGFKGSMMVFVIGTGIGSAMFSRKKLYPNTELGHLDMKNTGYDWEVYCSDATRKREMLEFDAWGKRINEYFTYIEFLFSPELIILGGGASKKFDKLAPHFDLKAKVVPAHFLNEAGIIGAAMAARENL